MRYLILSDLHANLEALDAVLSACAGKYEKIVSREVFASNWASLAKIIAAKKPKQPEGAVRWKGFAPNKVWTSAVMFGIVYTMTSAVWPSYPTG